MRTQVAIVGAGPAGLMLARLLALAGIDAIILERRSPAQVLARIRAGVLEEGTMATIDRAGVGARMHAEGMVHSGVELSFDGRRQRIAFSGAQERRIMVYGQTELTRDLMAAGQGMAIYDAEDVQVHDIDGRPWVSHAKDGLTQRIDCDFIAGCDGYLGVTRASLPRGAIKLFEHIYPTGWLGVLVDEKPAGAELVYASHARGFALCSQRSPTRSRYYLQVPQGEDVDNWSDNRFWDELRWRLDPQIADAVTIGPSIEKSVVALRSFVAEPLRFGRLFLAGDAAHIVPPTGAKGLNLAINDVALLADGLVEHYAEGSDAGLDAYSGAVVARAWQAQRFSAWMTNLFHTLPDRGPTDQKLRRAEFDHLIASRNAQETFSVAYTGAAA